MIMKTITAEEYDGHCTTCNEFTCGGVEPDAEDYHCEACEEDTVIGTENALIMGELTID
jgi:hypothetical protein